MKRKNSRPWFPVDAAIKLCDSSTRLAVCLFLKTLESFENYLVILVNHAAFNSKL